MGTGHGRYDPGTDVRDDISTETDRVIFLKSVAQVMLTKSRIKLNIKRLYAADGLAVKELLKMATLLYKATTSATDEDGPEDMSASQEVLPMMNSKLFDAKVTRQLASEITQARPTSFSLPPLLPCCLSILIPPEIGNRKSSGRLLNQDHCLPWRRNVRPEASSSTPSRRSRSFESTASAPSTVTWTQMLSSRA